VSEKELRFAKDMPKSYAVRSARCLVMRERCGLSGNGTAANYSIPCMRS
jgi:hypothetical protein